MDADFHHPSRWRVEKVSQDHFIGDEERGEQDQDPAPQGAPEDHSIEERLGSIQIIHL